MSKSLRMKGKQTRLGVKYSPEAKMKMSIALKKYNAEKRAKRNARKRFTSS